MSRILLFIFLLLLQFLPLFSQNFTWQADTTFKYDIPGERFIFHTYLVNDTDNEIRLRVMRIENNLPLDWTSSFCVGGTTGVCYAPFIDTIPDPVIISSFNQIELAIDFQTTLNPTAGNIVVKIEDWYNTVDNEIKHFTVSTDPAHIKKHLEQLSGTFKLHLNYPNPFNPITIIPFEIGGSKPTKTVLTIYNVLGQIIRILIDDHMNPGLYETTWDGKNNQGIIVSSGLYLYELRTEEFVIMNKMVLLK